MAGNVTAFNTVWTYDIYQTYLAKGRSDSHYLRVAHLATVLGTLLSVSSAYIVLRFDNLMDYMQLIGAMFIAPFFVIFFLGMFWKRTTATAGFYGMLAGVLGCLTQYILYQSGMLSYRTPMASTLNLAIWGGAAGLATAVFLSFVTKPPSLQNLKGLVYSHAHKEPASSQKWYRTPEFLAVEVLLLFIFLNVIFR
jgi:SSS family solute:Na+ symporter